MKRNPIQTMERKKRKNTFLPIFTSMGLSFQSGGTYVAKKVKIGLKSIDCIFIEYSKNSNVY